MRKLFSDRRFRQALSLTIDRDEISKIFFHGLGVVGQNTVLRSPVAHEDSRMAAVLGWWNTGGRRRKLLGRGATRAVRVIAPVAPLTASRRAAIIRAGAGSSVG